ncbi:hypothetical protein TNCT_281921 [Trichonephila clavata]|uniref:Uncharacterized protein n=1 Tax=Trichonephila clavata TaxID=2740835 RepID=A0A8X6LB89_TRICU|nr:hypothetical protein TNCT_281921 [Trichonephila clavata]
MLGKIKLDELVDQSVLPHTIESISYVEKDSNGIGLGVEPMNDLVCDSEKLVLCGGMQTEAVLDVRDDMVLITVINDARE